MGRRANALVVSGCFDKSIAMGMSVWYLIATLCLVLVSGEIFENISKSFYDDKSETSTPKPNQHLSTMQEYVLYLTPDQAQALQATGAIVRPLPQLENIYQQQRQQFSTKHHTEPHISSSKGWYPVVNKNKNEFYKELLLHQAMAIQSQQKGITTAKPPLKFKYSPKPRHEYATWYIPKVNNKTSNRSTEYVRYLPNYEIETIEMKPYNAQPITDYHLETQTKVKTYTQNDEVEKSKQVEFQETQEPIKSIKLQTPDKVSEFRLIQRYGDIHKLAEIQDHEDSSTAFQIDRKNQKPVKIQNVEIQGQVETQKYDEIEKPLELSKLEEHQSSFGIQDHEKIKETELIQKPEEIHPIIQIPTRTFTIERMQNQQPTKLDETSMASTGPVTFEDKNSSQSINQETVKLGPSLQIPTPLLDTKEENISSSTVEQQHTTLLVQQDKINESIAERKALINNERAIQTKLQEMKESNSHNTEHFAIELDKLKENLGKQNILAQKIAAQKLSKKPQGLVKEELASQRRRPIELEQNVEPSPVVIPRPYPVSWGIPHPIPVPVLQQEKDENEKVLAFDVNDPLSIYGSKNFYPTVSTPFALQEGFPRHLNHEIPFAYHAHEPDNFAILRHIWEH